MIIRIWRIESRSFRNTSNVYQTVLTDLSIDIYYLENNKINSMIEYVGKLMIEERRYFSEYLL